MMNSKDKKNIHNKGTARYVAVCIALLLILAVLFFLSVSLGSVKVSAKDILELIIPGNKSATGSTEESLSMAKKILVDIRLPRVISAVILGGSLAVSGYLLQTFFGNPIAGPFTLGISSGAKLMVSFFMVLALSKGIILNSWAMVIAAFAGSMISTGFILMLSGRTKSTATLIICGIMIGYICSSVTELIVTFADDSNIVNLHYWSMGSFSGMSWAHVMSMTIICTSAMILLIFMMKPLEAYLLGENEAAGLGVNIRLFRIFLILISSVLSAMVTAFAGPVSFVGVAVPHIVRKLTGTNKPKVMIPIGFLGGAVFCLLSDLLARLIFAPTELSISTVTAVFGAPVVIMIMLGRKRKSREV